VPALRFPGAFVSLSISYICPSKPESSHAIVKLTK